MVVLKNSLSNITRNISQNITRNITLYSAITSATFFHLLVKCVLLVFVIWVVFKWEPAPSSNTLTHHSQMLNIKLTYEQKKISITIICVLVIAVVWFLKKYKFYPDDLFFMAIILVIWVYAWRQNNTISGFLSKLKNTQATSYPTQNITYSGDIIIPSPGTSALDSHGISGAGPVIPSADKRSGVLPEHYDYLPDNMKRVSNPAAFDPMAPLSSEDELPQFNRMINLLEPSDHPTYKLTNEVLMALENKCLAHDSTDAAKPMTEFMRQNGAGQSKWAFVGESDQSSNTGIHDLVSTQETTRPAKSLNDKAALQEMFSNLDDNLSKYDTHYTNINNTAEYNYSSDTVNKKYPGVDNYCSGLGYCTNVNLPNKHSLNIIATNKIR